MGGQHGSRALPVKMDQGDFPRPGPGTDFGLGPRYCSRLRYAKVLGTSQGDGANAMGQRIQFRPILTAALVVAAFGFIAPTAQAASADYCITCKNPDETYRCRVTGSGAKPSDALKLYCVIRTAKEGNHASCSAKKATAACVGLVKVYTYDGPTLPQGVTSDPRVRELNRKIERDRQTFQEPEGAEPKSLFELGGRAVDASRKGLRNAGSAIGLGSSDSGTAPQAAPAPPPRQAAPPAPAPTKPARRSFARRSYDCMLSLFRDCGGE